MFGSNHLASLIGRRSSLRESGVSCRKRRGFTAVSRAASSYIPEQLEGRVLLSSFTPAEMRQAYGVDQISLNGTTGDGTGQTIAIVIPGVNTNINHDVYEFGQLYSMPINAAGQPTTPGAPSFTVLNQTGGTGSLPGQNSSFEFEEALDVEWAHAIAPMANIILAHPTNA